MNSQGPEPAAVKAQVERITASRSFHGLDRLGRFLRFVVGETIEGRACQIKEYVIGLEVYQKDASYDPRSDSTVRVEATKLRSKLARYYETEGQADSVVISIPKGSYAPVFEVKPARRYGRRRPAVVGVVVVGLAVTAGVIWLLPRTAPKPPAPPRMMPLTSFEGNEFHPSLSPDGKQVAFGWNGEKQDDYDIYVTLIDGGTPLRLTTTAGWEGAPAWSPDGRQIAFLRARAVFLVSPMGGAERKLARATESPVAWTSDGKHLAMADPSPEHGPPGILLVSVVTGEKRRLTSPPEKSSGDSHPAFSPDGRSLAFVRGAQTGGFSLCWAAVGGGEPKCRPAEGSEIAGITWTADSRDLVFSSTRGGGYRLWRIPASQVATGEPRLVPDAGENASYPVIAGDRLAYQRLLYDVNIWQMEVASGTTRQTKLIASTRRDSSAQYSPDGSRVAFLSDRTGELELWTCDREARNFVQLTSFRGPSIGSPRWSPDGSQIAFDSTAAGSADIYVVGLDGISLRRLTTEDSFESRPSWSSVVGSAIYFRSDRSGSDQIWKMPSQGGAAVQVTRDGGFEALESLDGKWLYFVKSGSRKGLWGVPTSGGNEELILEAVWPGHWAVAEKGMYFVDFSDWRAGGEVQFYDWETHRIARIGRIDKTISREWPGLSATRDGRWILFSQADQFDSDLILLDHFR